MITEQTTELKFSISSRKKRRLAFFIDEFIMISLIFSIISMLLETNLIDENNPEKMILTVLFVIILGGIIFFTKDSFKGISVGKWMIGIMIRDENSQNEIPSFGRLFLRNIFILIAPIESIIMANNDQNKRLGDKVAKTLVVDNPNNPPLIPRISAAIGIGVVFFAFIFLNIISAIKNSDVYKLGISEIEKNEQIIAETGGIKGYGMMPTGRIDIINGHGQAQLEIKVLGNIKDLNVGLYLVKEVNESWKLIEIKK